MNVKRCIFHIPYKIDSKVQSGTNIRPVKMLECFKKNGYEVELISGYSNDRKKSIKNVMKKIKSGIKYDFVYSESSTMPTLLTDKNHIPIHPFVDFEFLQYCSKNNIKIGLFYRDIHWKFDQYKKNVSIFKRFVSKFFYEYDLRKYVKILDVLYLPSINMYKYLNTDFNCKIEELPPGADVVKINKLYKRKNESITVFYVGGLNENLYNLEMIFKCVSKNPCINFIVCCRENEWMINKHKYETYMNNRIKIIHKSGEDIYEYVESSDIMCLHIKPTEYWKFAMPVKLFSYIGFKKPILAVKGTLAGEFVEKNNIGWYLDYNEEQLDNFFTYIMQNKNEIHIKECKMDNVLVSNTWKARSNKVINDLIGL